ncbi:hypothetical protein [Acidocella facilis]|uniref:hypothetical protein n=1 Tax=Acidocella facilis TaxID=525 RepID=UPI001F176707|nr:hypothetical protein [Acidocella facilis]
MKIADFFEFLKPDRGPVMGRAAEIEAALRDLADRRAAVKARAATAAERREMALLSANAVSAVAKLEAEDRAISIELEQLDLIEQRLIDQAAAARDAEKRARGLELARDLERAVGRYHTEALRLLPHAREAIQAHDRLIAEGFREAHGWARIPAYSGGAVVVADDVIERSVENYRKTLEGFRTVLTSGPVAVDAELPPMFRTEKPAQEISQIKEI